jgi:predicted TIM-barrel fold metal-dependent hydrolase
VSIIDVHTHAFPDKIASRAGQAIGEFYGIDIFNDGTFSTLFEKGAAAGVSRFAVLNVATNPAQACRINDSLARTVALYPDKLIGFAGVHPDDPSRVDEVERARSLGLKGIKIHPDIQKFPIDDPRMLPIYEAMGDQMILFTHAGDYRYDNSSPARILGLRRLFPRLPIICGHFGGWSVWKQACELLCGEKIYVDTSSTAFWNTDEQLLNLIRAFGVDWVMFGTDYPVWNIQNEVNRITRLNITSKEKDAIFYKNAEHLFGI